jgi:hypothetical protein
MPLTTILILRRSQPLFRGGEAVVWRRPESSRTDWTADARALSAMDGFT